MNKVYRVIWSKARNCYIAVSEFANAHSKGGKGARALLASALLLSAGLTFFSVNESQVAAYTPTAAVEGQYTVFAMDKMETQADKITKTVGDKSYTYIKRELTIPDTENKISVYVREGYTAALVSGKRYDAGTNPQKDYKIVAYQTDASKDSTGLLFADSVDAIEGSKTLTGAGIKDVAVTLYTAGASGKGDTPYNWSYYIQNSKGEWVDGGSGSGGSKSFIPLEANGQGMYVYDGELLDTSYLYVIKGADENNSDSYQVGVFVDDEGNLYKGNVYGGNNEILKTAVDSKNNIYSFWGAENDDPNILLADSNMTIGELNQALGDLVTNVRVAQGDDIQKIDATKSDDGGTISLMRRGTYDEKTKTYTGSYAVEGTLKLTSDGGNDGNDVTLHVKQADAEGIYADAFTLAAGSKVEALGDNDATLTTGGTAKKIKINGTSYDIVDTTLNTAAVSTGEDGSVIWKISDTSGKSVDLKFKGEDNINISSDGGVLKVKLANALTGINSITGNGTIITLSNGSVSINGGLNVSGKITGVANGAQDTDAVNMSQLNAVKTSISTLDKGALKYDAEDKNKITLGGTTYNTSEEGTPSGGTTITNVSYATVTDKTDADYDGSQAVNMDRLNDSIDEVKSEIGSVNGGGHTTDGDGILKDDLRNTVGEGDDKTYTHTTVVDAINKVDTKVEDLKNTFNETKEDYDKKFNDIDEKIDAANANHTAFTVNDGTVAPTDGTYSEEGNLQLKVTTDANGKSTYDVKLADTVVLGKDSNAITLDGTTGEATISQKLTVGDSKSGITIGKPENLGKYTKDVGEHKQGDTMEGYVVEGLVNTTTHYEGFANGDGKAATEEQLKEAVGDINLNLEEVNTRIDNNADHIQNLSNSVSKLNTRVNRVGAGAAALAALHPLDFDPDDKWDFAGGYGNYAGANATSIGAYYRPNADTMLSVAGSFGGGENMVNAGVSLKLGSGEHSTTSKVAMAKEIKTLRATVEEQGKQIAALTALVEKLTGEKAEGPEAEEAPEAV